MRAERIVVSLSAFLLLTLASPLLTKVCAQSGENEMKRMTNEAFSLLKRDRDADALAAFEKVLGKDSTNSRALYGKGLALRKLRRPSEAIHAYKASLRHSPDYALSYFALGNVYIDLERYNDALTVYAQALQRDARLANAHYQRGLVYQKLAQSQDAIAAFRAALEIDKNYEAAHHALGLVLSENGQLQEALLAFQNAANLKASEGNYYRLAEIYNKLNQPRQALAAAESGLRKKKDYAPLAFEAGVALKALGKHDEAVKKFEIAAKDLDWKQSAEYQIGEIKRARGQKL